MKVFAGVVGRLSALAVGVVFGAMGTYTGKIPDNAQVLLGFGIVGLFALSIISLGLENID